MKSLGGRVPRVFPMTLKEKDNAGNDRDFRRTRLPLPGVAGYSVRKYYSHLGTILNCKS